MFTLIIQDCFCKRCVLAPLRYASVYPVGQYIGEKRLQYIIIVITVYFIEQKKKSYSVCHVHVCVLYLPSCNIQEKIYARMALSPYL